MVGGDTPLESVFLLLDSNSFKNYKDWPLKLLGDGLEVETFTQRLKDKDGRLKVERWVHGHMTFTCGKIFPGPNLDP